MSSAAPDHDDLDEEFERLGRAAGRELRRPAPEDGAGLVSASADRRRTAKALTTTVAVVAVVVATLLVARPGRDATTTQQLPARVELSAGSAVVTSFDMTPDGRRIVTGDEAGVVTVFDSTNGGVLLRIDTALPTTDLLVRVAWSPDAKEIGVRSGSGAEQYWYADGSGAAPPFALPETPLRTSKAGASPERLVSPDGSVAVEVDYTGARLVDASTGADLGRLASGSKAYAAAFSADGSRVAVKLGRTVVVWQLHPLVQLDTIPFPAYQGTAEVVEFTADARRLAFTVENRVFVVTVPTAPSTDATTTSVGQ